MDQSQRIPAPTQQPDEALVSVPDNAGQSYAPANQSLMSMAGNQAMQSQWSSSTPNASFLQSTPAEPNASFLQSTPAEPNASYLQSTPADANFTPAGPLQLTADSSQLQSVAGPVAPGTPQPAAGRNGAGQPAGAEPTTAGPNGPGTAPPAQTTATGADGGPSRRRAAAAGPAAEAEESEGLPLGDEFAALPPLAIPLIVPLELPPVPHTFDAPATLSAGQLKSAASAGPTADESRRILAGVSGRYAETRQTAERLQQATAQAGDNALRLLVAAYEQVTRQTPNALFQADLRLTAAYDSAVNAILAAAQSADRAIVERATLARRTLAQAAASGRAAVKANGDSADQQISTILANLSKKYVDTLSEASLDCEFFSADAYDKVGQWRADFNRTHPIGNYVGKLPAENEAKQKAAPGLASQVQTTLSQQTFELQSAFTQNITQVKTDISNGVKPSLQKHADRIRTEGVKSVNTANNAARRGLRRQTRDARQAVAQLRQGALQQLAVRRRAARAHLEVTARQAIAGARREAMTAVETVAGSLNQALPHYGSAAAQLHRTLLNSAGGGPESLQTVADNAGPAVLDSLRTAQTLQTDQMQTVGSNVQFSLQTGANQTAADLEAGAGQAVTDIQNQTLEASANLNQTVETMTGGFSAVADGVNQATATWSAPLAKVFAETIKSREEELNRGYPAFARQVNTHSNNFKNWVRPQHTPDTFPVLRDNLQKAWDNVSEKLEERIEALLNSFDAGIINKVDEAAATGALRGVTAAQGNALRYMWQVERHEGSLDYDLMDKLDEGSDDYNAAINYLNGNTAAGARFELEASMHWYNDEEDRIEAIMRSLSPEQLEELHGLADWKETEEDVRDALGGLDLNVFDALNAGNHARADAYQLIDRIDRARFKNNADALNSALAEFSRAPNPEQYGGQTVDAADRWAAVQREVAHIKGQDLTPAGQPITQEQASQFLYEYATRDIELPQYGGPGGAYPRTLRVEGRQADLARAIIFHGEQSAEARAARLGVEVERSGGPNMLNLDTALVDPRLNPNNPVPEPVREQARREREQMLAIFAEKYGRPGATENLGAARIDLIQQLRGAADTSTGADLAEALVREEHPSPATAAIAMEYAMEGAGTNEALIDRTLGRMNRDEIKDMRHIYDARPGRNLYAELGVFGHGSFGEVSGDDRLRVERELLGVPRNDRERAEVAAFAIHQQRKETGGFGSWLASGSYQERSLDFNEARLNRMLGGPIKFGPDGEPIQGSYTDQFDREGTYRGDTAEFGAAMVGAQLSAQNYSAKIDQYANFIATTIAVVGAIAAAVATVVTGGAASPLLMAAIAGATGLTAMGAQAAIKGGRYGWEQAVTDLGMTAVQALTAGVGQSLSLASRGGMQGVQAGMRTGLSLSAARELAESGVLGNMGRLTGSAFADKMLIGVAGGALSSLGQTALSEHTYEGGPGAAFDNLLFGMFRGAVTGGVTATVSSAIEDVPLGRAAGLVGGRPTLGEAIGQSTSVLRRGLGKGLTSGLGGAAGRGVELSLESARGTYRGDAGDIFVAMGEAGLQSGLQSGFEGGAEALGQRYVNALTRPGGPRAVQPELPVEPETPAAPARPVLPGEPETPAVRVPLPGEPAPEPAVRPQPPAEPEPAAPPRPGAEPTEPPATPTRPRPQLPAEEPVSPAPRPAIEPVEPPGIRPRPTAAVPEEAVEPARPAAVRAPATEGTAAGIEGAEFRGDTLRRPRLNAEAEAGQAARTLVSEGPTAGFARVAENDPGHLKVAPAVGGEELTVRIRPTDSMPPGEEGIVPVARYRYNPDSGEYEILVSTRAPEGTLERALAHELTEIRAAHGAPDIPDALRPGGFGAGPAKSREQPQLSPHDRGRLAELEVLGRQIATAQTRGDEAQAARLRDETQRLLAHLGVIDETPAARARRELVQSELDSRPAARQLLDAEVQAAQANPFLRTPPADPVKHAELLVERLEYARRLGDSRRVEQVLEQARQNLVVTRSEFDLTTDGKFIKLPAPADVVSIVAADGSHVRLPRDIADSPTVAEMMRYVRENRLTDAERSAPSTPRRRVNPDPGEIDPDTVSTVRRRHRDNRLFQDWDTFKDNFGITVRSSPDELRRAFRLWADGHYITAKGNVAALAAASRVPDIEARPYTEVAQPDLRLPPGTTEETTLQRIVELQAELETTTKWARRQEINAELQKLPTFKRASEDVGEAAAKRFAQLRFGVPPEQITTGRGSGVPDLLFNDPDTGRLVVVEAKGGDSPLGARLNVDGTQMVQQGTREYLESLAQAMQRSSDTKIQDQGRKLELALRQGNVDYFVVRQPYSRADGTLELPRVAKFDIR
ncbi:MAG: hypothetical protein FOGNACKC_00015 [Anaerolineae bacterium]|nr:hypothetical protein [Anaerolineae bacterium]